MRMPTYDRFCKVALSEVFPLIRSNMYVSENKGERIPVKGQPVRVTSLRLRTFARKGIKCSCCGLEGKFFAIERSPNSTGPYHLNLWAINEKGQEIIMTHDHIIARALGGGNTLSECQTMCGPCNWKKGQQEGEEVRRIRELTSKGKFNEHVS